jgi:hypothetical protein
MVDLDLGERVQQGVEALHRHEPADSDHERGLRPDAPRGETRLHARRDDGDAIRVTRLVRLYSGGASRCSTNLPNLARFGGSVICHISAWTWWRNTILGPVAQRGEKKGMPFQISTHPSFRPCLRNAPLKVLLANTAYLPDFRTTLYPARSANIETCRRPQRGDAVGVELRSAGFGIVEVAPREDVHPTHVEAAGLFHQLSERPALRSTDRSLE